MSFWNARGTGHAKCIGMGGLLPKVYYLSRRDLSDWLVQWHSRQFTHKAITFETLLGVSLNIGGTFKCCSQLGCIEATAGA